MILELKIDSKPFSINNAYYRNRTRTKENREWADNVQEQLSQYSDQIIAFKEFLNNQKCPHLELILAHLHPARQFYTAKNDIHIRTMDLSNVEKLIIDLIFDKRHNGRTTNSGTNIVNLEHDDKRVINLNSMKGISKNDKHEILIKIIPHTDCSLIKENLKNFFPSYF